MKYIGKSNKFYTLWEVNEETRNTMNGRFYKVITHQYIKNISFDLYKATSLYPNAILDETLRGHRSWTSYEYEKLPEDLFQGGKYKGDKIADCTDYSYLHWCWDLGYIIPYNSRELVIGMLEKVGYRKINENKIATPEEVEKIENSFKEVEDVQEILEKFNSITVVPTKNLDELGNLIIGNICYMFPNYKEMDYNGYEYGLPIDSNGKAKRIKNKEIEIIPESYEVIISEYGWGAEMNVTVKDFKIK